MKTNQQIKSSYNYWGLKFNNLEAFTNYSGFLLNRVSATHTYQTQIFLSINICLLTFLFITPIYFLILCYKLSFHHHFTQCKVESPGFKTAIVIITFSLSSYKFDSFFYAISYHYLLLSIIIILSFFFFYDFR